jgi:hypothetical protein
MMKWEGNQAWRSLAYCMDCIKFWRSTQPRLQHENSLSVKMVVAIKVNARIPSSHISQARVGPIKGVFLPTKVYARLAVSSQDQ